MQPGQWPYPVPPAPRRAHRPWRQHNEFAAGVTLLALTGLALGILLLSGMGLAMASGTVTGAADKARAHEGGVWWLRSFGLLGLLIGFGIALVRDGLRVPARSTRAVTTMLSAGVVLVLVTGYAYYRFARTW